MLGVVSGVAGGVAVAVTLLLYCKRVCFGVVLGREDDGLSLNNGWRKVSYMYTYPNTHSQYTRSSTPHTQAAAAAAAFMGAMMGGLRSLSLSLSGLGVAFGVFYTHIDSDFRPNRK